MSDPNQNLAIHLIKNNPFLNLSSPDTFNQQLLYMNNFLSMNPALSQTSLNLSQFSKEQLTEYQLTKIRLNQELINANSIYNLSYNNYNQYAELPKTASNIVTYDPNRYRYIHEEPKPQHSYIGLIAIAILSMPDQKMVLADIYQHILDNYPYFRNRGPGWRNSIRHNLSLNDCFVKSGRSANGKGHYWAIHPANLEDFKKNDFRRRKAQRKVRRHMGLDVPDDDDDDDSPIPSPVPVPDKSPDCSASFVPVPNPFVQVPPNPILNPANPFLAQQAFDLFNTLRFALPPSQSATLPENLCKQLISFKNSHHKEQELRDSTKAIIRKQFSIDSLLAHENKSPDSSDNEYSPDNHNCPSKRKRFHSSPGDETVSNLSRKSLHRTTKPTDNCSVDSSTDTPLNPEPVNLKLN